MTISGPFLRAAQALRQAGWLSAQRFVDALLLASPFAAGDFEAQFGAALAGFQAALARRNLRELTCSPTLFAHYQTLNARVAQHTNGFVVAYDDFALAGRPMPAATMRSLSPASLVPVRARYESALLTVLRGAAGMGDALDELDACMAELGGPDPYDVWRLAAGCARALRATGRAATGEAEAKRFYARCNLVLADQMRGLTFAPRSFVRAALALLWRDYALFGAAAEDAEQVELLNDYGLTVAWHVAGTQASEALWEAGAAAAEQAATGDAAIVRDLGVLSVNVYAYEDFLQTADASMAALASRDGGPGGAVQAGPAAATQACEAAYRVGAAAWALGLGHVGMLSDALGLAWRRRAHTLESGVAGPGPVCTAIDQAAETLRAMLLRVAAGVAPPDSTLALSALTQAIERA